MSEPILVWVGQAYTLQKFVVSRKKKKSNYLIKNDFKRSNLRKRVKILKNKILYNNERSST